MGFLMPDPPRLAAPPPAAPPFGAAIQQPKPARKPMQPTFLGSEKTPSGDFTGGMERGKTLLGQ